MGLLMFDSRIEKLAIKYNTAKKYEGKFKGTYAERKKEAFKPACKEREEEIRKLKEF